jgi:hypothetical protein
MTISQKGERLIQIHLDSDINVLYLCVAMKSNCKEVPFPIKVAKGTF